MIHIKKNSLSQVTLPDLIGENGLFSDGDWVESKDQDQNGDVRLIQLADVGIGEYINKSARFMTSEKAEKLRCTFLKPGDILIARMPDPIGRACVFPGDAKPCVTVVDICILRPDHNIVDTNWLVHRINSSDFIYHIQKWVTGTTRQRISRSNLSTLSFSLPPLADQKRIAAILDMADSIRWKRQHAIKLADDFIRATFLDMFGDPVTNSKGWKIRTLEELTSKIGSGATPRGGESAYVMQGISLIRSLNVHDDAFVYKNLAHISTKQAEDLSNVKVEASDVLLNITGASVCRCSIVPSDVLPARVNQHVCIIRPNKIKLTSEYLLHCLISKGYKNKMLSIAGAGGATREALTKDDIKYFEIPTPPIELQNKFVSIKNVIQDLKYKYTNFVEHPLFGSLTQRALRGEL